MKLDFVYLSGFRGFRKPVKFIFSESFTVIDGRNGVGKSTIFDAIEFALTGRITKYLDATASGESVGDYLWWMGEENSEHSAIERFVKVGFRSGENHFAIQRTPLDSEGVAFDTITNELFDTDYAPKEALTQLCASTIIRDEHISRLSLDLKEGDRFRLLRDAIGAIDAESWIDRAKKLHARASERLETAISDANSARSTRNSAQQQIDQAHATMPAASLLEEAASRLQNRLSTTVTADQLPDLARRRIADLTLELEIILSISGRLEHIQGIRSTFSDVQQQATDARDALTRVKAEFDSSVAVIGKTPASTSLSKEARQVEKLVELGRNLNLRDGHCPLCERPVSERQFLSGLEATLGVARQLDSEAVDQAKKERIRDTAKSALLAAKKEHQIAVQNLKDVKREINEFDELLKSVFLDGPTLKDIEGRMAAIKEESEAVASDLRILDTISLDRAVAVASSALDAANKELRRAELRLGRARLAKTRAKAIYDATRRAAAESLEHRLDRVLPLMSELYKRLRPHAFWDDIKYSVRGDVRRFLKLEVGGEINPQFVFSSGQRRATGLAFLLSVNLSIAWSRWQSILLDDPVQHIDDFRAVHLAEVLGHICQSGRQIICAVEDSALADLMCRRLTTSKTARGKRLTLGSDEGGALSITHEQQIEPHIGRALVLDAQPHSA